MFQIRIREFVEVPSRFWAVGSPALQDSGKYSSRANLTPAKEFLWNLVPLKSCNFGLFSHKNLLYESHLLFFGHQDAKFRQERNTASYGSACADMAQLKLEAHKMVR
jgi:hypothetical protein